MFYFDPLYLIIVGPTIILAIWAQFKVKAAFSKWSEVGASSRISGAEAARRVLAGAGLHEVRVEETHGFLSDHYDPRDRTLRLSPEVYRGSTVAAIGVAAHEAGHALQHAESYALLKMRTAIVPFASVGSWIAWPMIAFGILLHIQHLALAGVIAFSALVVFQLITLPVELDASRRAKAMLATNGIVWGGEESHGVKKVLDAAALTYVAATIGALAQLFYFLLQLGLFGRSSEE
jgi:hypothetical protein